MIRLINSVINFIQAVHNSKLGSVYFCIVGFLNKYLFSFVVLYMRLWIAQIFWYSGLTKISSWSTTLYLFRYEYAVPVIPVEIAALMATAAELSMPILLVFGFLTRLASIPLLCMVAVIQFTYLDLIDHMYWAVMLLTIICYGPGRYSLDCILCFKRDLRK